jgi:hypothetical protein
MRSSYEYMNYLLVVQNSVAPPMSMRELERIKIIAAVAERRRKVVQAAESLALRERQVIRLVRATNFATVRASNWISQSTRRLLSLFASSYHKLPLVPADATETRA